jgi:hypothetical protein
MKKKRVFRERNPFLLTDKTALVAAGGDSQMVLNFLTRSGNATFFNTPVKLTLSIWESRPDSNSLLFRAALAEDTGSDAL